jgi:hypothetical protein
MTYSFPGPGRANNMVLPLFLSPIRELKSSFCSPASPSVSARPGKSRHQRPVVLKLLFRSPSTLLASPMRPVAVNGGKPQTPGLAALE